MHICVRLRYNLAMFKFTSIISRTISCIALATALACASAFAQTAEQFSPQQQKLLQELYAAFPEFGELQTLHSHLGADLKRRRLAEAQKELSGLDLPEFGEEDGAEVVEFSDYQCGYCKRMFPVLRDENVRVKVVEFPVLGELSVKAARYALAARNQGGYDAFHIALMERGGRLSEDALKETAAAAGLDWERLQKDGDSAEVNAALQRNRQLAAMLEVRGTPFLVVGKRTIPGAINAASLKKILEEESAQ